MKALEGVKVIDFTHMQAGPTCTQLLAWFGAEVIKVERPKTGDGTRHQLVDIPDTDSLFFATLNHNKKSIELNLKNETGKKILTRLIESSDVLVENFAPGAFDRLGFTWERIQKINPRIIVASIKGFGPGKYEKGKAYENIAQCVGGSASTTGFRGDMPLITGAQIGDSGTGLHLCLGIVTALFQREKTGTGQKVNISMQDSVINLVRVKVRDQQRLAAGPLVEFSQYCEGIPFGDTVPRAGNDGGGPQPGRILKCKNHEDDPNAFTYFSLQEPVWPKICDLIGKPEWKTKEGYTTVRERYNKINEIWEQVEELTKTKTKFEVLKICNSLNIPAGPVLSIKELVEDEDLYKTGTLVKVEHPERGEYISVGCPIKLSDSLVEVIRSPLLGEHTDEVLSNMLNYTSKEISEMKESGAFDV